MTNLTYLAALAADGPRPARTEDLGERLVWVGVLLLVVIGVYVLMWRAWKRRGERQGDLPEPPAIPQTDSGAPIAELTGRYHGSTSSGDWLDRIVAHGLGTRSLAELTLTGDGVAVRRQGATDFFIPASALRGARLDKGIAGKVLTEGGLLVITWEHGGRLLDSGFRSDHPAEHTAWVDAVQRISEGSAAAAPDSKRDQHDQEGAR